MYDIAVIGGGPAGATLARLIGRKYKVLLIERRTFKEPLYEGQQKCCGGLLDPDAQKMLASFSLGLPGSVILSPQMFSVRTIDLDNSVERYYQRHYINIDREQFDKWLVSLVPSSVDILCGCTYKSHEQSDDTAVVKFIKDGREFSEKVRLIIGADGAFSRVRRAVYPDNPFPKQYVAVQEWFENPSDINYYGAIFDSEVTDFYSWLIPKENYLILGSAILPGDVHTKFDLLKQKLTNYGFSFGKSVRKNGTYLLRPENGNQICTGKGMVGLIGEAAGFISPSSAEGMSYAFRSALSLAEALYQGLDSWPERYKANTAGLRRNILIKNLKSPIMYNKLLRRLAMKSGLMAVKMHAGNYVADHNTEEKR